MRRFLQDWPGVITFVLCVAVVVHGVAAEFLGAPSPLADLATRQASTDLYIGTVAFTAVLAGFAGVLVVFAMSPNGRFQTLRRKGGTRLRSNWLSPISVSLLSGFSAIVAAVLSLTGRDGVAVWFFEFALLACAHGAIRLTWLLATLIDLVVKSDVDESEKPVSLRDVLDRP